MMIESGAKMDTRPTRFHLSLKASRTRFAEMVSFYERLFGVAPAKRKPGYAKFDVTEPSINLTLNEVDDVKLGEVDHFGVQVWSDEALAAARQRLSAAGMSVLDEENVECCFAGQNKFWLVDPDGRHVELFHVLRDIEHHGKPSPKDDVTACCSPAEEGSTAAAAPACCAPASDATPLKITSLKARASECCG
jgi:hypothetical protein